MGHPDQGIVHVIGPELGLTQPGKTIVCGDSHTSTHGAFGAIAFGIGTSEVEHVLSTQTLWQNKPKQWRFVLKGATSWGSSKGYYFSYHCQVRYWCWYRTYCGIYWRGYPPTIYGRTDDDL